MPLYEFVCQSCRHRFEQLVMGDDAPSCPECRGRALEKMFSAFAVGSDGGGSESPAPGACGACGDPRGPGACSR
jgi:putative FmdB family regulatory protein